MKLCHFNRSGPVFLQCICSGVLFTQFNSLLIVVT